MNAGIVAIALRHGLSGLDRFLRGLVLLSLLALAALWWWSGTQHSLDWAWQRWAQPRGVSAQGLAGSLRHGLRAGRMAWARDGLRVQAEGVQVDWLPRGLLDGRLHLTQVRARALSIKQVRTAAPGPPSTPPERLVLPLDVVVDRLAIERLQWQGRGPLPATGATDIAGAYRYEGGLHRFTLRDASLGQGRYQGEAQLNDRAPLRLQARVRGQVQAEVPGTSTPRRLTLHASTEGLLSDFALQAQLRPAAPDEAAEAPQAAGHARVRPWHAIAVTQASARLQHIDLAWLWPGLPRTRLRGQLDLRAQGPHRWTLAADLANDLPGPWDRERLPVSSLQIQADWREGVALVRQLRAAFGSAQARGRDEDHRPPRSQRTPPPQAGRVAGTGRWLASDTWQLQVRLEDVRPEALHSALAGAPVSGPVRAWGRRGTTDFEIDLQARDTPREGAGHNITASAPSGTTAAHDRAGGALALQAMRAQGRWRSGRLALEGELRGQATLGPARLRFEAKGQGTRTSEAAWRARIDTLQVAAADPRRAGDTWSLQLRAPLALRRDAGARLEADAGSASLFAPRWRGPGPATLSWDPLRWGGGELVSSGRLAGLPLGWFTQSTPPPGSDLIFDAQWQAHLAQTLRLHARVAQTRGDLTLLAETAEGTPARVRAGLREASLTLESAGDAVNLALRWDSERAGIVQATLATRLARGGRAGWAGGWTWPQDAALTGRLQARMPRIAVWSLMAPPGWRLRGSLAADLALGGTRLAPRLDGELQADDLALRSIVDGIALENGRLRARLDGQRLRIDELRWQGGGAGGGQLVARGDLAWIDRETGLRLDLTATLERLRVSVRRDRQVTVSGTASVLLDRAQAALRGQLRIDRARLTVPDEPAPSLGADVVVHNLPPGLRAGANPFGPGAGAGGGWLGRPIRIDAGIDLGDDLRVAGRGVDAGLRGHLRVTGPSLAQPRVTGTIETVEGRYTAYGQALELARGVLRFTGRHDDPALDIIAVRPNLARQVGVQVTGRAQAPALRLWSQEAMSEAEKLSWLVLGHPTAAGGAETLLLEQAAVSLLARRAGLGPRGIASALGLDEISLRRDADQQASLTFGKRLARNMYAAYERSLSGAIGTLYVFYNLTERLTVRAEAGDRTGIDLVYAVSFDELARPPAPAASPPR